MPSPFVRWAALVRPQCWRGRPSSMLLATPCTAAPIASALPCLHRLACAAAGDALYAFELSLSLEKLNFQKLRALHEVAEKHGDSQMCDFVGEWQWQTRGSDLTVNAVPAALLLCLLPCLLLCLLLCPVERPAAVPAAVPGGASCCCARWSVLLRTD